MNDDGGNGKLFVNDIGFGTKPRTTGPNGVLALTMAVSRVGCSCKLFNKL
ncbi:MAG: hypothetical protein JWN12_627 [Candidatus Saccharibacteria bacterium]|nr:hypothetical protein [Candidatus Saccharibacteria bacterium]